MRPRRSLALAMLLALGWVVHIGVPAGAASIPASVTIHTLRSDAGDSWWATGAIHDAGPFVDPTEFFAGKSSTFHAVRVFEGDAGTFTAVAEVRILPSSDPSVSFFVVGRWAVTSGSGAYADLHGGGAIHEEAVASPCCALVGVWTGRLLNT